MKSLDERITEARLYQRLGKALMDASRHSFPGFLDGKGSNDYLAGFYDGYEKGKKDALIEAIKQ